MDAATGRPGIAPLVLFKISLLQHCYNLSDPQAEKLVGDRMSFRRFVGLGLTEAPPDETTLVKFRQRLRKFGLEQKLFDLVQAQLDAHHLVLKTATIIDATLIDSSRRRPTRAQVESGTTGDPEASYAKKDGQAHFGYKAHVAIDAAHGLIRTFELTTARVADTTMFPAVLPETKGSVFADKGYDSRKNRDALAAQGASDAILRRRRYGHGPVQDVAERNRQLAGLRSPIERVFGYWKRMLGYRRVRYRGLARNRLELIFKALAWNLKRAVTVLAAA